MRTIITVIGKDMVGILARVSGMCAQYNINIEEINQSVLQDMFCMIMLADVSRSTISFADFADKIGALGKEMGMSIQAMHEDVFNSMHRI